LFGVPARDTKSRLDERVHGRELVAAGARDVLEVGNEVLNRCNTVLACSFAAPTATATARF